MEVHNNLNGKLVIEKLNMPVVIESMDKENVIKIQPHGSGFELKFNESYYYAIKDQGVIPMNTQAPAPRFTFVQSSKSGKNRHVYTTNKGEMFFFDNHSNDVYEANIEDPINNIDLKYDLHKARERFNLNLTDPA